MTLYKQSATEAVLNASFIGHSQAMARRTIRQKPCDQERSVTKGGKNTTVRESDMTIAFYPGSFDPMTNGHLDVLIQALNVASKVIVAIGIHPGKAPLFSFEERAELIKASLRDVLPAEAARIDVVSFNNLVVDAARKHGAGLLLRGLRDGTDLDYEMQMAGMNRQMAPDLQTVFLPAGTASRPITATLVRQIAAMGGNVEAFVPKAVLEALNSKLKR
jgi:pantetheine-phosphate adenylyltransferase